MIWLSFSSRSPIGLLAVIATAMLMLIMAACDGSDPRQYAVGGSVSGLDSGQKLVLNDNGDIVTLSANSPFVFPQSVNANGSYAVTVVSQPEGQICTVSNPTGAGVTAQVSNVTVACSAETYVLGGTVSGLPTGEQLVLKNNAADALQITANGAFTFATPVAFDGSYIGTVATQTAGDTCTGSQGRGAGVVADVTNVAVVCSANSFTIGGTVTGLAPGAQITLNDNSGDPLTLNSNGA